MATDPRLKVSISWSGPLAKDVAVAIRGWLPKLFDVVEAWASDVDIAAGQRSLPQVERELVGTRFGIVIVTASNQNAPWLNFEAGAMSKVVEQDSEQRVVPLLVDIAKPTELTGPLAQFHAKVLNKEGMRDCLRSVADVAGVDHKLVDERVDKWWSELYTQVEAARNRHSGGGEPIKMREPSDMLDEILTHVRAIRNDSEGPRLTIGGSYPAKGEPVEPWAVHIRSVAKKLADDSSVVMTSVNYYDAPGGIEGVTIEVHPNTPPELLRAFEHDLRKVLPAHARATVMASEAQDGSRENSNA